MGILSGILKVGFVEKYGLNVNKIVMYNSLIYITAADQICKIKTKFSETSEEFSILCFNVIYLVKVSLQAIVMSWPAIQFTNLDGPGF